MNKERGKIFQSQELKQVQRLILSPQMQQSLHLLQLPVLELSTIIADELEQNPLLEYAENVEELSFPIDQRLREQQGGVSREEDDLKTFVENSITQELSLFDVLMLQAKEAFASDRELLLAEAIIGNLDPTGFLKTTLEEISVLNHCSHEVLAGVLEKIQTFDPPGIAARDLRESFLIQLRVQEKEKSLAFTVIERHFEDLLHNRLPAIAKALKCTPLEIRKVLEQEISHLDLHPGSNLPQGHYSLLACPIIPDIYIVQKEETLSIEINEKHIPSFRLNDNYMNLLNDPALSEEARHYLEEKAAKGKSLLRNIHDRHKTLYKIAEELVVRQRSFFLFEAGQLLPLTMKEIAETIGLHESTVVRAVANKYLSCPRGIFPFRSFFTHAYVTDEGENISAATVKDLLREIIKKEDKTSPLSDEAISSLINAKGIPCARRTVVKYRHELGIGKASQRKSY